jgi:DNA-damage-inducible protein J
MYNVCYTYREVMKMHKIATVNTRIDPELKTKAEDILHKVGLTSAEAVRLFYMQVCLHKGLPFDVRIPNKETLKARHEADKRKTRKAKSVDDLFKDLG